MFSHVWRAVILACAVTVLVPVAAYAVIYREPVKGVVADPFRPPANPYGPGNRGWEYQTEPGSDVRAAAPGTVTFAGQVGGSLNVVILHDDGVRTTLSKLASIDAAISKGVSVREGQVVGKAKAETYFGARCGNVYIDPARLFDLRVYLVPEGGADAAGEPRDAAVCGGIDAVLSLAEQAWLTAETKTR